MDEAWLYIKKTLLETQYDTLRSSVLRYAEW